MKMIVEARVTTLPIHLNTREPRSAAFWTARSKPVVVQVVYRKPRIFSCE